MSTSYKIRKYKVSNKAKILATEENWHIAIEVFPDLELIYHRLLALSVDEAVTYRRSLLIEKKWSERGIRAQEIERRLISRYCGENIETTNFLENLLSNENWEATRYLVKIIDTIGNEEKIKSLRQVINKKYPVYFAKKILEEKDQQELKKFIAEINSIGNSTNKKNNLDTLKNTILGKFYLNHIKSNPIGRLIAITLWKKYYPIYARSIFTKVPSINSNEWLTIESQSIYIKKENVKKYRITSPKLVSTPAPKVYPEIDQNNLVSPHENYIFPEIYTFELKNVAANGGSNLFSTSGRLIAHDLYKFTHDYTSEELHGRIQINTKKLRARFLEKDINPIHIEHGAFFVDACAPNYAHWLTEVLPRIALFCKDENFYKIPIIINSNLHKNILESLFLVAGSDRKIITLPVDRDILIDNFYTTSVAGYVPFERRDSLLKNHSHGLFSPDAFDFIKEKINNNIAKNKKIETPEKIYLRRNSGARNLTNPTEIESLLISNGFSIIEPEKLNFTEQVVLFKNAKIIFASSGAALANLIFCKKNIDIYIFLSKNIDTSYWYWQNIACATGNVINYILGTALPNEENSIHSDFSISTQEIQRILSNYEK